MENRNLINFDLLSEFDPLASNKDVSTATTASQGRDYFSDLLQFDSFNASSSINQHENVSQRKLLRAAPPPPVHPDQKSDSYPPVGNLVDFGNGSIAKQNVISDNVDPFFSNDGSPFVSHVPDCENRTQLPKPRSTFYDTHSSNNVQSTNKTNETKSSFVSYIDMDSRSSKPSK